MKKEIAQTIKEAKFLSGYPKRICSSENSQEESATRRTSKKVEVIKKKRFDDQVEDLKIEDGSPKFNSINISEKRLTLPPLEQSNCYFAPNFYTAMSNTYMDRQALEKKLSILLFNLKIQECFIIRTLLQLQTEGFQPIVS